MKLSLAAPALALCLISTSAWTKDLGVQGTVFPILETDMRQLFREQLETLDRKQIDEERRTSAQRYLQDLPKRALATVDKTSTAYVDLSITLTSDIQAPVKQTDGSWKWQVLHPAGTKVNPVAARPTKRAMLFIDGSQSDQVKFAKEMSALGGAQLRIIEAGEGDIAKLNQQLNQPIYYGFDWLMDKFKVAYLPSLVYVGDGETREFLSVTSFARPFKTTDAALWPVLRSKLSANKEKK